MVSSTQENIIRATWGDTLHQSFEQFCVRPPGLARGEHAELDEYDMSDQSSKVLKENEVIGGYNKEDYISERLWASARDGTKIPILHTVEVIDWYTGGPKPVVLRHL